MNTRTCILSAASALALASAAASADLTITWYSIDGGGALSATAGTMVMGCTIGQPDAGTLSSGSITLEGGYWAGAVFVCPADYDHTGFVDTDDFTAFVVDFEAGVDAADFDRSGFVDTDDFTAFVLAFEAGC